MKSKMQKYQKNNFSIRSKKIILCVGLASFLMLESCDKKPDKTIETHETTTIVQDTVVKEVPKDDEGTSVKIDSTGVDVNSKKVDVEIK